MMNERESRIFSLNKLQRIFYLDQLGFNTPQFFIAIKNLKDLSLFFEKAKRSRISVRTQGKGVLGPHFPNAEMNNDLFKKLSSTIRKGYELLLFESIDPSRAIQRGTIWVNKETRRVTVEYSESPGTVREMEKLNRNEISILERPFEDLLKKGEEGCSFAGYTFSKYLDIPLNNYILEFSKMPFPVGKKFLNYIFWEIRYGG